MRDGARVDDRLVSASCFVGQVVQSWGQQYGSARCGASCEGIFGTEQDENVEHVEDEVACSREDVVLRSGPGVVEIVLGFEGCPDGALHVVGLRVDVAEDFPGVVGADVLLALRPVGVERLDDGAGVLELVDERGEDDDVVQD